MAEKQYPATVKDFRQNSKVLEIKKEGKDCVSLDRKLMDEQDCIERRMLKAYLNSQIKNAVMEICFCFVVSTINL